MFRIFVRQTIRDMKTSLTQKEILEISRNTGMSFFYKMPKAHMLQFAEAALIGQNEKAVDFAQAIILATKAKDRSKKLRSLGV
jgi:hypothetical protein